MRLNAAISVNLKPNEDGEYAEVQTKIKMFQIFYTNVLFIFAGVNFNSGAFHANIANGGSHQWAVLSSACIGLYHKYYSKVIYRGQYYTLPALVCSKTTGSCGC